FGNWWLVLLPSYSIHGPWGGGILSLLAIPVGISICDIHGLYSAGQRLTYEAEGSAPLTIGSSSAPAGPAESDGAAGRDAEPCRRGRLINSQFDEARAAEVGEQLARLGIAEGCAEALRFPASHAGAKVDLEGPLGEGGKGLLREVRDDVAETVRAQYRSMPRAGWVRLVRLRRFEQDRRFYPSPGIFGLHLPGGKGSRYRREDIAAVKRGRDALQPQIPIGEFADDRAGIAAKDKAQHTVVGSNKVLILGFGQQAAPAGAHTRV